MPKLSIKENEARKAQVMRLLEKKPNISIVQVSKELLKNWNFGISSVTLARIKKEFAKNKQPELPLKSQPELIDFNALFEHMKSDKSIRSLYIKRDGESFTADITIIPDPITKKVRVKT
jgi:hypothetical protein